jgi:hypothetical protein
VDALTRTGELAADQPNAVVAGMIDGALGDTRERVQTVLPKGRGE